MTRKEICAIENVNRVSDLKIYKRWIAIKSRCFNKKSTRYRDYGGRNITMCEEWKNDFIKFYKWSMENGFKPELQIDRIDNNGNYEPFNCRWITVVKNTEAGRRRKHSTNTTGYIGITFDIDRNKFMVRLSVNKKRYNIGRFDTLDEAIRERAKAEIKHFGRQVTNI